MKSEKQELYNLFESVYKQDLWFNISIFDRLRAKELNEPYRTEISAQHDIYEIETEYTCIFLILSYRSVEHKEDSTIRIIIPEAQIEYRALSLKRFISNGLIISTGGYTI
jgi:hypothetical protein